MSRVNGKLLYWIPRALGLAFAIFIGVFALDVFSTNLPLGKQLVAFAIHLLPTYLILIVLAFAWKWESLGGAGFIALGLLYMWITGFKFSPMVYLIISGLAFLTGLLFLADWFVRHRLRPSM